MKEVILNSKYIETLNVEYLIIKEIEIDKKMDM